MITQIKSKRKLGILLTLAALLGLYVSIYADSMLEKVIQYHRIPINIQIQQTKEQAFFAIFGASVTILAIVFSISHFIISQISQNYSPYFLEAYKKDYRYRLTFYLIAFLIPISLFTAISEIFFIWFYFLIILVFVVGLILLVLHFRYTLVLSDPREVLNLISKDLMNQIKEGESEKIKSYLSSMGDIAVKSLHRNEENITIEYISGFHKFFKNYLNAFPVLKPEVQKKLRSTDFFGYWEDQVTSNIYENLGRTFSAALDKKDRKVTTEIASKLFFFTFDILEKSDTVLFEQLIDTKSVRGAVYLQLFENAMEHEDVSRRKFITNIYSILQTYFSSLPKSTIDKDLLHHLIDLHLFRMNKLILDFDDYELFVHQIDLASRIIVDLDPRETLTDIVDHINRSINLITYLSDDKVKKVDYVFSHLDHKLQRSFKPEKEFLATLNELKIDLKRNIKLEGENEQLEREFSEINIVLDKYSMLSRLHRTFFLIGAYNLFLRGQDKKFDHGKYIKELWEHTSPEDADAHHINKTPVCFDPFWLIYLVTYGGENSIIWFDKYDFEFGDYHGIRDYVYQYWILLMGRWKGDLNIPGENVIETWKKSGYKFKLEFWYELLNDFLLYHKDKIENNFQKIIDNKLYEGLYEKEDIDELKEKFDDITGRIENTLKILQRELAQP